MGFVFGVRFRVWCFDWFGSAFELPGSFCYLYIVEWWGKETVEEMIQHSLYARVGGLFSFKSSGFVNNYN